MATLNKPARNKRKTHEGAPAAAINAEQELRRSVLACLLWEDTFYESGESIGDRIAALVPHVKPDVVAEMANEARNAMHLRHAPLWLCAAMCKSLAHRSCAPLALQSCIQRPDELAEFATMCRKALNVRSIRRSLVAALRRFDEYQLAKYRGTGKAFKLRDVLRLIHAKPANEQQAALWKRVIDGTLQTPDTWEVELSASKDKCASWVRLIQENRLGGLATLRNLRNMEQAGVGTDFIRQAIRQAKYDRVLPFRFIAAARHAVRYEPELEAAMFATLEGKPKLPGTTVVLVDVSGSMNQALSAKSDMRRYDAGCGLAMVCRELCEEVRVVTFSSVVRGVPARRGFSLRDAIQNSQPMAATYIGVAVAHVNTMKPDRLIVISDEQSHDRVVAPGAPRAYMLNVASYQNGVGYGNGWTNITGWSDGVLRYIQAIEEEAS